MGDYVDIREKLDGYTTIPCKECDGSLYVDLHFASNVADEWYCDGCKPEELRELPTGPDVTVRL